MFERLRVLDVSAYDEASKQQASASDAGKLATNCYIRLVPVPGMHLHLPRLGAAWMRHS